MVLMTACVSMPSRMIKCSTGNVPAGSQSSKKNVRLNAQIWSNSRRAVLLGGTAILTAAVGEGRLPARGASESIFVGQYDDPSHPGCRREIDAKGNVYGADPVPIKPGAPCLPGQPTTPWQLNAKVAADDNSILIDFDPIDEVKQGPVTGTWTGEGLKLPNGLWTKK
uniref:Uncharacterized protein n=1 Tax=Tetraselmis chuii TaxID=63592 RepID=A0A7S1SJW0_9CHLO|mmetsp:Transcript_11498/g.20812  ORF Transcript_11498/g.20812 Transcript_11498/m.20812 type:complete len:167 (+) Transcript_11498:302-802(+)|eukprot:CAMPEP_0177758686 /NCGR_PEP_ID=MMETSP0491_2-20121128/4322_1 /TAXON_ID=63592 /ORGANISM="Tetraselmis chuii, Strain PLY429" /LENGTH=166 /DNA_ID=CAMNT_0019274447 /DNA_START=204 /DNA_END=704 /DNA_ORIENTATION=-